jgi:hypothetical protein
VRVALVIFDRSIRHFRCSSFPRPEAGLDVLSSMPLPMPRVVGSSGRSGEFVRGSDISTPVSSEIPARVWVRLSGFISISLTHLFLQRGGFGQRHDIPRWVEPWCPLSYNWVGSSEAPVLIRGDLTEVS